MTYFIKLLLFGFCIIVFGCSGYQYVPSPNYVPVNLEKDKLTGNISFNSLQVGYSLSNHISVFTTGYIRRNNGGIFKQTAFQKENGGAFIQTDAQKYIDLGLTYFNKKNEFLSYEIVTGVGNGVVKYSNFQDLRDDYEFSFNSKKLCMYIQPDISIRYGNYLDFTIFSRINRNVYYQINKNIDFGEKAIAEKYDKYLSERELASLLFFEPGFQFRVGFEKFKLQLILSPVYDLKNTGIKYRQGNIYLSFVVQLKVLKKQG